MIYNQEEVLEEIKKFYENLYSCENCEDFELEQFLENVNVPRLNKKEADSLEGVLTLSEASKTLLKMKNNKSPGSDGFTVEFLKVFWRQLGNFIIRSINYGFLKGQLSVTQKQGIITCIPKGEKSRHFIKNWRPITLLNNIYKIASGSIANRIKNTLNKLIDSDQTGFIQGRYIGENTRLVYDIMQYADENDITGMLLMIDFEKVFDSVSWTFMNKVFDFFKFGSDIKTWIKILHKNSISAVNQGGNLSKFFEIKRGCRQGDPIAPYIFVLCAEILAIRIRNNKKIKGIQINQTPILLSQYADDTTLILDGTKISLLEAISELKCFAKISGLKMNLNKTQVIWLGNKKYSDEIISPELNLNWGNTSFTLLGIEFHVDLNKIPRLNYDKKLVKIKSVIKSWNRRRLTPIGKVQIIKSLLISQFNHLFISLPNPDDYLIKKLNTEIYNFLWNSKIDKLKREIVVKKYIEGGLNMIHLMSYIESLKLTWIRRLYSTSGKWQELLKSKIDTNVLANCGVEYIIKCQNKLKNLFWKDVFKVWEKVVYKIEKYDNYVSSITEIPIWYNKSLTIDNKSIFYKEWFKKGVSILNDFIKDDENCTFYSLEEFKEKFNIRTNFLHYYGIILTIQRYISKHDKPYQHISYPNIPINLKVILKNKKGAKTFYNILLDNSAVSLGQKKWNDIFEFDKSTWKNIYTIPFKVTRQSSLQWFQYRINQHILTTNSYIYRAGIVNSPYCNRCETEIETIEHALWECDFVQNFLNDFTELLDNLHIPLPLNKELFIFGIYNNQNGIYFSVDNLIILLIKHYIYKTRCLRQSLSTRCLTLIIYDHYNVLKYIANSKNVKHKENFYNNWEKWKMLLGTV